MDDLLDVSRLELARWSCACRPIDLNDSVTAARRILLPSPARKRHSVKMNLCAEQLPVRARPVRVEQVFGNLIVNAAKFTPGGRHHHHRTLRCGGEAVVRVQDNGMA